MEHYCDKCAGKIYDPVLCGDCLQPLLDEEVTAMVSLQQERDAALARVAELEALVPKAWREGLDWGKCRFGEEADREAWLSSKAKAALDAAGEKS